jgi:hypothetical protein
MVLVDILQSYMNQIKIEFCICFFKFPFQVLRMIDEDSKDFNFRRHSAKFMAMLGDCLNLTVFVLSLRPSEISIAFLIHSTIQLKL